MTDFRRRLPPLSSLVPFEAAFRLGMISDEQVWLNMLKDRNKMSHVYSENEAHKVYENIPGYFAVLKELRALLSAKYVE